MRIFFLLLFISSTCFSQVAQNDSPYQLDWVKDGIWLGASLGLTGYGFTLIQNKEPLTEAEVINLSKDDVFFMDRWSAGYTSNRADEISYIPFYASFAMPIVAMVADGDQRSHALQISVLFIETMATTGAIYTISAGLVNRSRPLVYNDNLPMEERKEAGAQRSFIGGHTAATAAATFFTAKVFNDFHPDSSLTPYIWAGAAAVPAYVAYLRLKSGKHFLSDNLVGYGVGALSGILIPQLHKKENSNISLFPSGGQDFMGNEYTGIYFSYKF